MRSVKLAELKEGDILAEDIFNSRGVLIVAKNTVLNGYIIDRLSDVELHLVNICCDHEVGRSDNEGGYLRLKESYEKSVLEIKAIINGLAAGRPLDREKVDSITKMAASREYGVSDIVKVLNVEKGFDEYTYTHSLNAAFYSMLIGRWMGLDSQNIGIVVQAGLLHDIGKTNIPLEILNKNAKLSEEEFELIKKHPIYGYKMAKSAGCFPEEVCEAILSHHERIDGSGYPYGACDRQTSLHTKIVAVADVYDAMTSDRPYKKRSTPFEVFEMFKTTGVKILTPK